MVKFLYGEIASGLHNILLRYNKFSSVSSLSIFQLHLFTLSAHSLMAFGLSSLEQGLLYAVLYRVLNILHIFIFKTEL